MYFAFYICDTLGFLKIMYMFKTILTLIQFIIPLGLIVWIAKDLFQNVINPDNKDGVKKIGIRLLAAIIIFIIPIVIPGILKLFDMVVDESDIDYKASKCYTNASSSCIDTINKYLNCEDIDGITESEKAICQELRRCNDYTLSENCKVSTTLNDQNCNDLNSKYGYKFAK